MSSTGMELTYQQTQTEKEQQVLIHSHLNTVKKKKSLIVG